MSGSAGYYVGEFLGEMMLQGLVLRDVHMYNVGWRTEPEVNGEELHKGIVVFDPGHTPTDRGGDVEELRMNWRHY